MHFLPCPEDLDFLQVVEDVPDVDVQQGLFFFSFQLFPAVGLRDEPLCFFLLIFVEYFSPFMNDVFYSFDSLKTDCVFEVYQTLSLILV